MQHGIIVTYLSASGCVIISSFYIKWILDKCVEINKNDKFSPKSTLQHSSLNLRIGGIGGYNKVLTDFLI